MLRISLAPSALADPLAGLVFACRGFPPDARAWWLLPASAGVYHGALVLNDWADRAHDARTRPGRPIPSGAVQPSSAFALGLALVLIGVGCAALAGASSARWMAIVAALAVFYDVAGRGSWRGPLLLGLCRAGNLGAGIAWAIDAGITGRAPVHVAAPVLYGAYVFFVSRAAIHEDSADELVTDAQPRVALRMASTLLMFVALFAVLAMMGPRSNDPEPSAWEFAVGLALGLPAFAGAFVLWRMTCARRAWQRTDVERAVGAALRRLLAFTAAVALWGFVGGTWEVQLAAALILAGWPIGHLLRRAFPPS